MRLPTKFCTSVLIAGLLLCVPGQASENRALYWSISRDSEAVGYLLGTIHSEDPRVLDFPDSFIEDLTSNERFAMEMVPDLPTLTRLTAYMQYQDGTTLESRIGRNRYERLKSLLAGYRVPDEWVQKMKVWAAMMTLSVPPPETGFFMDFSLSLRAAGAGLEVIGLETLEQQLSFLENMPMEQQVALLDQAMADYDKVAEVHLQMIESYLAGDLQALQSLAAAQLNELDAGTRDYFTSKGIDERNRRMLATLLPMLQESRVFVAVGALHLPGDEGLISLLRREGFELSPLPLPLSATQSGR
jgi:uncharacterized protein YbaP (TraB family)